MHQKVEDATTLKKTMESSYNPCIGTGQELNLRSY